MRPLLLATATAFSLASVPFVATAQDSGAHTSPSSTTAPTTDAPQTASEANAAVPPATETTVTTRTTGAGQQEVITTTATNAAPPPASSMDKDYPICRGSVQDSCKNPGEGGAPGRSRALDYWPGEPASERDPAAQAEPSA